MLALGLMSGTSLDGVDVALLDTDGDDVTAFGPTGYRRYTELERSVLRDALSEAVTLSDRRARPGALARAEDLVTSAHQDAVETFLSANGLTISDIDVIGFHGQTVLHRPERRLTVQIGDGQGLADRLGGTVVFDMRAEDVAAGGQGAPLVPAYHQALVRRIRPDDVVAVLNLGGVANVTLVRPTHEPLAFDLGPANALLDDFMAERTGEAIDRNGAAGARGTVDRAAIDRLMTHPFFLAVPPKSLDRNDFRKWVAEQGALDIATTNNGAATLTALTAEAVAASRGFMAEKPFLWIVAGGGARNPTLLHMLAERLAPAEIITADEVGVSADHVEAQAFAYLAVRSLRGLPLTFPTTTGVASPMRGGTIASPRKHGLQTGGAFH